MRFTAVHAVALLTGATLTFSACGSASLDIEIDDTTPTTDATTDEPERPLEDRLQSLVEQNAATVPASRGQALTVLAPDVEVNVAAGDTDPDSTFRIASVTKTFTAAATLRLVEQGQLALDDTLITAGVSTDLVELLRSDGYDVDAITVAHLLNHTAGLADYADNDAEAADGPYKAAVLDNPLRDWTPEEQIEFAVDQHDPVGQPGERYFYNDTGYVLLGQILEARTGLGYAEAMRELLRYDELGLEHTYVELLEDDDDGKAGRANQYLGPILMDGFNPSFDLFGGGGLIANTDDVATFYRALGRGEVFDDPATFDLMTSLRAPAPNDDERAGIVFGQIDGIECWYHVGFWGVTALTCPSIDLTMAHTINQADPDATWNVEEVISGVLTELDLHSN